MQTTRCPRPLAPVLACFMLAALPVSASGKVFHFTGVGAIPDGLSVIPGTYGAPRTLTAASDLGQPIRRVTLTITMNHTWVGDLKIELRYQPADGEGATFVAPVVERIGATTANPSGHDANVNGTYTFTIDASNMDAVAAALSGTATVPPGQYTALAFDPTSGPDLPSELDAGFRRLTGSGVWELEFRDAATFDTGTVTAASINIEAGPLACLADFNNDGIVSTPDLVFFLARFGQACP